MLEVEHAADLRDKVGQALGTSGWVTVDQPMIDDFAKATGDYQWIHVDPARAKTDMPGGRTIAHGFLTLSLLPRMLAEIYHVRHRAHALNYGSNKVRFVSPVPSGSRIRLSALLTALEDAPGGHRIIVTSTVEVEGQGKPALVAETITLVLDQLPLS